MQLDFFKEEKPKKPWEVELVKRVAPVTISPPAPMVDLITKPRPYTVVKQGLTTTIWNEEIRNS